VFRRTGVNRDLIIGLAIALGVGALGWLAIAAAVTRDAAGASIRELGTLLAVLFGILAAVWWNQSAKLANKLFDQDAPPRQSQKDANTLSAGPLLQRLCRFTMEIDSQLAVQYRRLLLLAMSGGDIRQAVPISLRQRPEAREYSDSCHLQW